ncbi:MAG: ABC transporter substrate-binding protein [Clostridiales bacterium]|jgi:peptide/nickel transport system substrate-binding protein|nr:ABC transporter substrate-binding protein [Clostridiales bacterium]
MKVTKILAAFSVFMSAVVLLTACGANGSGRSNAKKDELIVAMAAEPQMVDPQADNNANNAKVARQMFECLVLMNNDGEIEPWLAEAWEFETEDSIMFHLRKGVKFHNGGELTAGDVLFSFKRGLELAPQVASILDMMDLEKCEIIDDYTIRIKMTAPFAPILRHLAHPAAAIVSEKAVTEAGNEAFTHAPLGGTGAFKFVSWNAGDKITMERFEDYWGAKPTFKTLTFRFIAEGTNRTIELETGAVDVSLNIQANDVAKIEENAELTMYRGPGLGNTFARFNTLREPLTDANVRLALVKALNVESMVQAVFFGTGVPSYGLMSSQVWGYNDEYPPYSYDPEAAKNLLADAGYPDGFEITLMVSDNQDRMNMAEIMQNQWKAIGISSKLQVFETGTFFDHYGKNDYDICIVGMTTVTRDADYGLNQMWPTSATPEGMEPLYSNPEVDRMLEDGRKLTDDEATRKKLYFDIQKIILDYVPMVPLFESEVLAASRANLKGFEMNAAEHFMFKQCYFE